MSIEMIIGLAVVLGLIGYFVLRKPKSEVKTTSHVPPVTEAPKVAEAPKEAPAPVVKKAAPVKKAATKKTTKKTANADLDSMNKTQLLAHAKENGIKANASLKKDEILERIKNG